MQRVLIVGGTGFIGSHLVNDLLIKKYKVSSVSYKKRKIKSEANFFFLDLSKSFNKNVFKKFYPNVIIYAASLDHSKADDKFDEGHQIGYLSLINILRLFSNKKHLKKIIFLSTAQVYDGYCKQLVSIDSKTYPKNAYSLFHLQAENYLKFFSKKNKNINVSCLRISNGYGDPFIANSSAWHVVINNLCLQAYNKDSIRINSNPKDYRNFIYVKDIVKEIIADIKKKYNNNFEIRNVGSKENVRINKVASLIKLKFKELLNKDIKIVYDKNYIYNKKIFDYKSNSLLNYNDFTSIEQGIENLINYIDRKNGKV